MEQRFFDLSVSCYGAARQHRYDVALLPWGATEAHNLHLPYLTDCILARDIAVDAARTLHERHGLWAMVMPPVTMGAQNPGQRQLPFCVHARYDTQRAILTDVVTSLREQGLNKLLIVSGHGGNNFKNMIRDLAVDYPDCWIASSEWFKQANPHDFFDRPDDHADELETSVMMHYHPELVRISEAGDGHHGGFAIPGLNDGTVWMPRNWSMVSHDTGIGDPHAATAEKGRRFTAACVDKYVDFLAAFAKAEKEEDLYLDY